MPGMHRLVAGLLCLLLLSMPSQACSGDGSMEVIAFNGLEWYVGPNNIDWDDAVSWVRNLDVDGGGWRMPSMSELRGLYTGDQNWDSHHSLPPAFRGKELDCWWAWSSRTDDFRSAWFFAFDNGEEYFMFRDASIDIGRVFAVRSPK